MSSYKSLQKDLLNIGMSESEISVYLTCLEYPKTTPTRIASLTGIKRTSVYPILRQLLGRNLIYKKTFSKKKYFFASSPKQAMRDLSRRATSQAEHITKTAESLIEKLELLAGQTRESISTGAIFLSGKAGIRELIRNILNEKRDIFWLGPSRLFLELDNDQQREIFQRLTVKRMENGTISHAMTDDAFKTSSYFHGGPPSFRQLRTLAFPKSYHSMIVVTGNVCGFIRSLDEESRATLFRDAEYAEILRFALQTIWDSLSLQVKKGAE